MKCLVPVINLDNLNKKIDHIRNKGGQVVFNVGKEEQTIKDALGYYHKYVEVEAYGKYVINGWMFVATIEHTSNGNIIRCVVPEMENQIPSITIYKDNIIVILHRNNNFPTFINYPPFTIQFYRETLLIKSILVFFNWVILNSIMVLYLIIAERNNNTSAFIYNSPFSIILHAGKNITIIIIIIIIYLIINRRNYLLT